MHPELEALLAASAKFATRKLREESAVPLFPAVLDSFGKPLLLNVRLPDDQVAFESVGGAVELLRMAACKTETSGAVICAPVQLTMTDGTTYEAAELLADHVDDAVAYKLTIPFRIDDAGGLGLFEPFTTETDDFILPRP